MQDYCTPAMTQVSGLAASCRQWVALTGPCVVLEWCAEVVWPIWPGPPMVVWPIWPGTPVLEWCAVVVWPIWPGPPMVVWPIWPGTSVWWWCAVVVVVVVPAGPVLPWCTSLLPKSLILHSGRQHHDPTLAATLLLHDTRRDTLASDWLHARARQWRCVRGRARVLHGRELVRLVLVLRVDQLVRLVPALVLAVVRGLRLALVPVVDCAAHRSVSAMPTH